MKKPTSHRSSNITTVGEALGDLLKTYHLNDKFDEKKLIESWPELMGPTIAKRTGKIFIKNNVLFIEIKSAPLKNELNMSKVKVIKLITETMGNKLFEELIFI